ncbi:MAG: hypothetical protein MI673_03335 [Thiotrichales bacterium]|nr:hypothetical protein [Thiotrichales bacterium]
MKHDSARHGLITQTGLREFFHGSIRSAVENQRQEITPETVFYLTNLLTDFSQTRHVFNEHNDGAKLQPLAMIYADAVEATSREQQNSCLKKLGDLSLFISGLFSYSLNRSLVDVDYYIAMGGNAYSYLANNQTRSVNSRTFSGIFTELAEKFVNAMEILTEVGDQMHNKNDRDIMRLYEIWQRTGSQLAAGRLRRAGIDPVATTRLKH